MAYELKDSKGNPIERSGITAHAVPFIKSKICLSQKILCGSLKSSSDFEVCPYLTNWRVITASKL